MSLSSRADRNRRRHNGWRFAAGCAVSVAAVAAAVGDDLDVRAAYPPNGSPTIELQSSATGLGGTWPLLISGVLPGDRVEIDLQCDGGDDFNDSFSVTVVADPTEIAVPAPFQVMGCVLSVSLPTYDVDVVFDDLTTVEFGGPPPTPPTSAPTATIAPPIVPVTSTAPTSVSSTTDQPAVSINPPAPRRLPDTGAGDIWWQALLGAVLVIGGAAMVKIGKSER